MYTFFPSGYSWLWTCFLLCAITIRLQAFPVPVADRPVKEAATTLADEDTTRRFLPHRVLMLTDTTKRGQEKVRTYQFYEKLKDTFYKTRVTRTIFDMLFVPPQSGRPPALSQEEKSKERYRPYQEKTIGNITIRKLPPFGPTVTDTSNTAGSWYKKAGNKLHFPTRNWVLEKNLLLEPGDQVNPYQLADSERLLRELPFVRDARIYLKERSESSDTVDVLVITQDVLPYSLGGSYRSTENFSAIISNNNLAGVGHELRNEIIYHQAQNPNVGYRGVYSVPNINGSFITGFIEYAYTDFHKTTAGSLQRDFYTPNTRWAGGVRVESTELKRFLLYRELQYDRLYHYRFQHSDIWTARSFRLQRKHPGGLDYQRSRLVVAARFSNTDYHKRPETTAPDRQYFFHDQRLYMASVGWSRRQYFRDQYIYGFGRTEDVPFGSLVNFTFGRENGEFFDRNYAGLTVAGGRYFWNFGYLYTQVDLESYFLANGQSTQRLLHLNTDYYSPLLEAGDYRFRQLITMDYTYGDRRQPHEFLTIGHENIRGLNNWQLRGTQRLSFRFETISFTPLYIMGFQLAGFAFTDIAILNNQDNFSLKGHNFQGFGFGARVRNENLTFNTFQFRFTLYPSNAARTISVNVTGIPSQLFNDFQIRKPRPFSFR